MTKMPDNSLHLPEYEALNCKATEDEIHFQVDVPDPIACEEFGVQGKFVRFGKRDVPCRDLPIHSQQLSLFGSDPKAMARMIDACANQVGRINLNAQCQRGPDTFPFTGRKNSAEGTLSVYDALRVFSIRTLVATKDNAASKALVGRIIRDRESSFLSTDYIF